MSGNDAFVIRQGSGWQRGLDNFLRAELTGWFGTRTWLIQLLIWVAVIDGVLGMLLFTMRSQGETAEAISQAPMIYSIFTGLFAGVAVIIIMQEAIVGERKNGTAAWVLSKPLSRPGFVLAKLFGNLAGILLTMILVPGLIAYVLISMLGAGYWLPFGSFLAAMVCLGIVLLFYQTMTLMFGALFESRGAVIGLSLAFIFGQQFLTNLIPFLYQFLPVGIFLPRGEETTITSALILGQPIPDLTPVVSSLILSIIFVIVAVWRFERIEL